MINSTTFPDVSSSWYVPYNWRGFYDFGTGQIGNWATHSAGPVHHALQLGAPSSLERVEVDGESSITFPHRATVRLDFPQRGGFNRWVPGSRTGEGPNVQWDWNGDGIQDTLFLDSCSGKSGGQTLNTSCAGIFSDTLPNGYLNAYANVGSTINVGPFHFAAGDTTVTFAPVRNSRSILRAATSPPPTTSTGSFTSRKNMGK